MAIIQPVKDGQIVGDSCTSSERTVSNEMGQDQFLQLLIAEMQNQDPLEPASNTEWVAQMATFSMVESLNSMQSAMLEQSANDLIGHYVLLKVPDSDGTESYIKGKVDYVTKENGETKLSVGDKLYDLDMLDSVVDDEYYEGSVAANEFAEMVKTLPLEDNLSLTDEGLLKSAREIYDGMTENQKAFVTTEDLTKLATLEDKMASMKATKLANMMKELPSEAEINAADEETLAKYGAKLAEISDYYQNMTDAQKKKAEEGTESRIQLYEKALGDRQDAINAAAGGSKPDDSTDGTGGENPGDSAGGTGSTDIAALLQQILDAVKKQG